MTRRRKIILLTTAVACIGLAFGAARARNAPQVATGFLADILCAETFISGLDPQRTFTETTDAMPGTGLITWAMVIDNLLRGLVPSIGGYTPVGASAALVADPADYVLAAAAGGLLLLGYLVALVAAGAILVTRRDVT